jgi:hypothetical protein
LQLNGFGAGLLCRPHDRIRTLDATEMIGGKLGHDIGSVAAADPTPSDKNIRTQDSRC